MKPLILSLLLVTSVWAVLWLLLVAVVCGGCALQFSTDTANPRADGWRLNRQYHEWQQVDERGVVTNTRPAYP